ncbi:NAD(P)-binding Rossmann-fold superfamily protein [Striga asiatica]|uniref:Dihydroflavonol 4-reductase n=1 Tax=Striga asiatica TaxID=4170 RepID=A0A5A7QUT8_STRAF|nr:NAD(P)-binding Rossmann-fold superfamily protein [Striga asiatica]
MVTRKVMHVLHDKMEKSCVKTVCVTGGAGYLASFLINRLLAKGYLVHATLRNLKDDSKVGLLKGLGNADTRLKLFEADIYNPCEFAAAVEGCQIVVHMATPLQHYGNDSQYKNTSEAAVGGVKSIVESCVRSNTVNKLIYTASVVASSPLKEQQEEEGGYNYKDFIDETCWTPLNTSYQMLTDYVRSKTLAEKEVLSYNGKNGIQVVSLACGLVGGDTIQSFMPESMATLISQAINDGGRYRVLRGLEDLLAKVPIAHVEDVIDAHVFSMETQHINGRFLCASHFLSSAQIAALIQNCQPTITIKPELVEDVKRETSWGSRKLENLGFKYKYDAQKIIHDSLLCAKKLEII